MILSTENYSIDSLLCGKLIVTSAGTNMDEIDFRSRNKILAKIPSFTQIVRLCSVVTLLVFQTMLVACANENASPAVFDRTTIIDFVKESFERSAQEGDMVEFKIDQDHYRGPEAYFFLSPPGENGALFWALLPNLEPISASNYDTFMKTVGLGFEAYQCARQIVAASFCHGGHRIGRNALP